MSLLRQTTLFCIGGGSYTLLELCWRRRSHISMFFLAGGCFLALGRLYTGAPRLPLPVKMVTGSAICTAGELATGLLLNRDYRIWDYRGMPLNFMGQICLTFSLLWMALSLPAGWLYARCQ